MVLPKAIWKNKYGILLLLHKIHVFSWHTDVRDNGIFTKGIEGENQTQTFQHKPTGRRRLKSGVQNLGCWLRGARVCRTFPGASPQPSETEPGALWLWLHLVQDEHVDPSHRAMCLPWRAPGWSGGGWGVGGGAVGRPVGLGNRFPLTIPVEQGSNNR